MASTSVVVEDLDGLVECRDSIKSSIDSRLIPGLRHHVKIRLGHLNNRLSLWVHGDFDREHLHCKKFVYVVNHVLPSDKLRAKVGGLSEFTCAGAVRASVGCRLVSNRVSEPPRQTKPSILSRSMR